MDQALIQVGLPVKCDWADCKTKGFVKPDGKYGGWVKRWHKRWYCPKHAKKAQEHYDAVLARYETPAPEPTPQNDLQNLMDAI